MQQCNLQSNQSYQVHVAELRSRRGNLPPKCSGVKVANNVNTQVKYSSVRIVPLSCIPSLEEHNVFECKNKPMIKDE